MNFKQGSIFRGKNEIGRSAATLDMIFALPAVVHFLAPSSGFGWR
jgi:hypothetical protein